MSEACTGCMSKCEVTDSGRAELRALRGGHPVIKTAFCGNQYFHHMTFVDEGDFIPTHKHTYPHVFQVLAGSIKLISEIEGTYVLKAGDLFDIPENIAHGMTALEDNTKAQCIHIMRWDDGTIVPFDYKIMPRDLHQITGAM